MPDPITPPAEPTPPPPPPAPAVDNTAAFKARLDAMEAEIQETRFAANYWQQKAEGSKAPAPEKKQPSDDIDPLEILAKEGKGGLKKLLASEGFISKDQVDALVNSKAEEIATSDQLKRDYPELNDQNSQFYKDTAPVFRQYVERGYSRPEALKAAARDIELRDLKTGKRETPAAREEREGREQAQRRADSNKGRKSESEEDDSEELTAEQKRICEAMGVSEEAYIKRAKAGVRISGLPQRKK